MFLRRFINIRIGLIVMFVLLSLNGISQKDTLHYIESPYRAEYAPHFKFGKFQRGFYNDSLKRALDILESTARMNWSRKDSLTFAEISLQTGNRELAHYYFENLRVSYKNEENYWYDHLIITYLENDFDEGLNEIQESSPMILEFSEIYFYQKIFEAQKNSRGNPKWYKTNRVLNWDVDTSLFDLDKDKEVFQNEIILPLLNLEKALKRLIIYVHEDDEIIANVCREMGHIIEAHLSLSQAYIAYSLGRHYNKWDKALLADVKAVKGKLTAKKYKIPNFRKYFPRIEYWRFDYEILKEKVMSIKHDTTQYAVPATMKPKEETNTLIAPQIIIIGGILLFFIGVALFVKTRKK